MDITPTQLIEYNKELILDDSGAMRGAGLSELFELRSNPFIVIYWFFRTHYDDFKTIRYYNSLPKNPEYWFIETDGYNNINLDRYTDWMKENKIEYKIFWYRHFAEYGILFDCPENAMAFKLRWL